MSECLRAGLGPACVDVGRLPPVGILSSARSGAGARGGLIHGPSLDRLAPISLDPWQLSGDPPGRREDTVRRTVARSRAYDDRFVTVEARDLLHDLEEIAAVPVLPDVEPKRANALPVFGVFEPVLLAKLTDSFGDLFLVLVSQPKLDRL